MSNDKTSDLIWISWNQHHDPAKMPEADEDGEIPEPDERPVAWPPPDPVLAFWCSGYGYGGDAPFATVVAVVRGTVEEAQRIVTEAWTPGVGEFRFAKPIDKAPGDRFPPPEWSVEMGRWPW